MCMEKRVILCYWCIFIWFIYAQHCILSGFQVCTGEIHDTRDIHNVFKHLISVTGISLNQKIWLVYVSTSENHIRVNDFPYCGTSSASLTWISGVHHHLLHHLLECKQSCFHFKCTYVTKKHNYTSFIALMTWNNGVVSILFRDMSRFAFTSKYECTTAKCTLRIEPNQHIYTARGPDRLQSMVCVVFEWIQPSFTFPLSWRNAWQNT